MLNCPRSYAQGGRGIFETCDSICFTVSSSVDCVLAMVAEQAHKELISLKLSLTVCKQSCRDEK